MDLHDFDYYFIIHIKWKKTHNQHKHKMPHTVH